VPKLLLADDSPTTQKVVQLTFADEGIDVVIADDGDAAMELFDHHKPDIVLADINIPGLNGYEVCEAIRKRNSDPKTPVVLLAGSFEPFDVEAAHRVGANDYLTKPFSSIRRLVATVTALLDTVVRADETAHDTVEPVNETPTVETAAATAPALPEPGAKQPDVQEPDMFSTSDIDHLYTKSVVEQSGPVDVAAHIDNGPAEAVATGDDVVDGRQDESAFDDELIETTYLRDESDKSHVETIEATGAQTDHVEPANDHDEIVEPANDHAPSSTTVSLPHIPLPVDDFPINTAPVPQSQIPTVSFEVRPAAEPYEQSPVATSDVEYGQADLDPDVETSASDQSETSQLDQSGDETYFEPDAEQTETPFQSQEQNFEAETPEPESTVHAESIEAERSYPIDNTEQATSSDEERANIEHQAIATSTPWDSVAAEQPSRLMSDDADLLEVPYQFRDRMEHADNDSMRGNLSDRAREIAPEIVDRIAQLTAAQISEEMVREIAKRVVPQVIEEVLTSKTREE